LTNNKKSINIKIKMNLLEEEQVFLDLISKNKISYMDNGQAYTSLLLWENIVDKNNFVKKVDKYQINLLMLYLQYIFINLKKINQLDASIIEIFIVNKNLIGYESYPDMTKVCQEIITHYQMEKIGIDIEMRIKQKILYTIENSKKILTIYLLEKYKALEIMDNLTNILQKHYQETI
jgi:hypothetical protein